MAIKLNPMEYEVKAKEKAEEKAVEKETSSSSQVSKGKEDSIFPSKGTDATTYQAGLDKKYKDDDNKSAKETFSELTNAGILNEHYYNRMICAVESLVENDQWMISMVDENGNISDTALADAVASSFDSELDLYIEDAVAEVMAKYGTCSKGYLSDKAKEELAAKGIRVDAVGQGTEEDGSITNRVYSFSLVDMTQCPKDVDPMEYVYSDEAKIVEDKAGNKGSILFADCLIPDGYAQNAEINLSSILDTMGYDCISKADFIGDDGKFNAAEYDKVVGQAEAYINSGEATANGTIDDVYGNVKDIDLAVKHLWGGSGAAPGQFGIMGELTAEEKAQLEADHEREDAKYQKALYNEILEELKVEYEKEHGKPAAGTELAKLQEKADKDAQKEVEKN